MWKYWLMAWVCLASVPVCENVTPPLTPVLSSERTLLVTVSIETEREEVEPPETAPPEWSRVVVSPVVNVVMRSWSIDRGPREYVALTVVTAVCELVRLK